MEMRMRMRIRRCGVEHSEMRRCGHAAADMRMWRVGCEELDADAGMLKCVDMDAEMRRCGDAEMRRCANPEMRMRDADAEMRMLMRRGGCGDA